MYRAIISELGLIQIRSLASCCQLDVSVLVVALPGVFHDPVVDLDLVGAVGDRLAALGGRELAEADLDQLRLALGHGFWENLG